MTNIDPEQRPHEQRRGRLKQTTIYFFWDLKFLRLLLEMINIIPRQEQINKGGSRKQGRTGILGGMKTVKTLRKHRVQQKPLQNLPWITSSMKTRLRINTYQTTVAEFAVWSRLQFTFQALACARLCMSVKVKGEGKLTLIDPCNTDTDRFSLPVLSIINFAQVISSPIDAFCWWTIMWVNYPGSGAPSAGDELSQLPAVHPDRGI